MTKLIDASAGITSIKIDNSFKEPFYIDVWRESWKPTTYYPGDVENIQKFSEEEYRSSGKAALGAIVGGVLTGGIGLIAGTAIGARKRKDTVFGVKFKDGTYVVFEEKARYIQKKLEEWMLKKNPTDWKGLLDDKP